MLARPASLPEEVIALQDRVPESHPLLRLLQAEVAVADAQIDKAEADARGAPTLTLGTRRQRAGLFADYEDALAVSLNVPLGGRAHVNAATGAERRSKVDAEVRHATARRALDLQLHEVEHELFVLAESLPLSEEQAQLARQQWDMARAAFEAGETDISQVVIALQQTRQSARDLELTALRHARLIAEFNQILGVLP